MNINTEIINLLQQEVEQVFLMPKRWEQQPKDKGFLMEEQNDVRKVKRLTKSEGNAKK